MKQKEEILRIGFRLQGRELEQVRDIQRAMLFNTELDAVRYLLRRGAEACAPMVHQVALMTSVRRAAERLSPQELLAFMNAEEAKGVLPTAKEVKAS